MSEVITVLLVDDHAVVRSGLQSFLQVQEGISVIGEASTGLEAIQFVEKDPPDVVTMDLVMPGMDGIETAKRIKELSPRTQIVVLTSYYEEATVLPAIR